MLTSYGRLPSCPLSLLRSAGRWRSEHRHSTSRHLLERDASIQLSKGDDFLSGDAFFFLDQMMCRWRQNPKSVHPTWGEYFEQIESGVRSADAIHSMLESDVQDINTLDDESVKFTARTIAMIRHFEKMGHFVADTDPLKLGADGPFISKARARALATVGSCELEAFGFKASDRDKSVQFSLPNNGGFLGKYPVVSEDATKGLERFSATLPPRDIRHKCLNIGHLHDRLKDIFTGPIGIEFLHIHDRAKVNWIRNQFELSTPYTYTKDMKLKILERTIRAVQFETFAAQKFATMKRFGLDGCEALIVGMEGLTKLGTLMGIESVLIAMSHRGRLNTLTNVMNKPPAQVFSEFSGRTAFGGVDWGNSGDVKYHMGVEYEYTDETNGKHILMSVLPNPSHLEAVDGVLLGNCRARQMNRGDETGSRVMPVLVHGDASVAGQGVVYESLQMCDLTGYSVGGTVHIVVNNQIGFTTDPVDAGSGNYCTDLAKAVNAPIFHVNADYPEAVTYAMEVALKYRQLFGSDVFVDLVGYRRFGHNELEMPKFTQPKMYTAIAKHPNVLDIYSKQLIAEGVITQQELDAKKKEHYRSLELAYQKAKEYTPSKRLRPFSPQWDDMATADQICAPRITGVNQESLLSLGLETSKLPANLKPHPTIAKVYNTRQAALKSGEGIDFGLAESLAFASLLRDGIQIRLAGQDVERGTFSHRHAIVHDQETGAVYFPLKELAKNRHYAETINIHNSLLSEYACLGFEYGYSLETPKCLNIWEAQFGDFANGAQIVIDQFIASGETKWNHPSGLVLLLPHGYDGQGPEHSSARIERFLSLCDDREDVIHPEFWDVASRSVIQRHNMQVCNITTASNFFHVLRRQIHRGFRKPLIVFTPKKLLRLREATSPLSEFVDGTRFARYISDPRFVAIESDGAGDIGKGVGPLSDKGVSLQSRKGVERLVLCSGQVYYDLLKARKAANMDEKIMISRVEQLSPFPLDRIANDIMSLPNIKSLVWAQEEPMNQGPWSYVANRLKAVLRHSENPGDVREAIFVGRDVCGSPASGDFSIHTAEQTRLCQEAMDLSRRHNSYYEKYLGNTNMTA